MKLRGRRSSNIEDRRRIGGGGAAIGGIGGVGLIVVLALGYFLGIDVTPILEGTSSQQQTGAPRDLSQAEVAAGDFVSEVLANTEEVWGEVFAEQVGQPYQAPVLVLFSGQTQSQCGGATAATGPFYCPIDQKVYLDTDFFAVMERQLGASGDFAAAYVVAHEVGHHVQNLLGKLDETNRARSQMGEAESNAVSVRVELQADCYSGIWARYAEERLGIIEPGDLEEAMNAASQIGDDTLQREAGQRVRPDSFTHGTSEQRMRWFREGYRGADMAACDTFGTDQI